MPLLPSRRTRRTLPPPLPSLPTLLLLLAAAAAAATATTIGVCAGSQWLEAPAPHGHAAARACAATGEMHVALASSSFLSKPPAILPIPLATIGFRHRGRWLTAAPGGGLVLDGVVVSEEKSAPDTVVEEEEEDRDDGSDVDAKASASGALGPSTVLSVQWRAEEDENEVGDLPKAEIKQRNCPYIEPLPYPNHNNHHHHHHQKQTLTNNRTASPRASTPTCGSIIGTAPWRSSSSFPWARRARIRGTRTT